MEGNIGLQWRWLATCRSWSTGDDSGRS